MNNVYYGVSPSSDFFAHYGVKGMKWGVRRAIERGNQKALKRHYNKAAQKLQMLSERSDKDLIRMAKKQNIKDTIATTLASGMMSGGLTMGMNSHLPMSERLKWSAIAGGVGAGAAALSGGVNQAYLSAIGSKRGNVKQNAKRKAWEKEMRKAFKGTPYARQINRTKRNIHSTIESAKKQYDPSYRTKKQLTKKDIRDANEALNNWANAFEKHYQTGLSRGMTHEQAERYSNNYIAKHGFKPVNNKRRR